MPSQSQVRIAILLLILVGISVNQDCPTGFDKVPPRHPQGICVVLGCAKPIKNKLCTGDCLEGYTKIAGDLCQVTKCSSPSKTNCTSCSPGYTLQPHPTNKALRVCTPTNCQSYNKETRQCQKCLSGYKINKQGICSFPKCQQDIQSQCIRCQNGYTWKNDLKSCVPKYCQKYDRDTLECLVCKDGSVRDGGGFCKPGIMHCIQFNQGSQTCFGCEKGYQLVQLKVCIKIDPLCLRYEIQGCTQCSDIKYKPINGICTPLFCQTTTPQNQSSCQKCEAGYQVTQQGLCSLQNCKIYNKNTSSCTQCNKFFTSTSIQPSYNKFIFVQRCLSQLCEEFDGDKVLCVKCKENYVLNGNGSCGFSNCQTVGTDGGCEKCVEGWSKNDIGNCVYYDCLEFIGPRKCKSCARGFREYGDTCLPDNCLNRNLENNICQLCPATMLPHKKFPKFCVFRYCKTINEQTGDCLECLPLFNLTKQGSCILTICSKYENITGLVGPQCTKCLEGYQPSGQACKANSSFCEEYSLEEALCKTCVLGYQIKANRCMVLKCVMATPFSTYARCLKCDTGYNLINLENGVQRCDPYNCTQVSKPSTKDPICLACANGYSLENNLCIAQNCKQFNSDKFCTKCNEGFYLNTTSLICTRQRCIIDSPTSCKKCQQWYFPDTKTGLCRPYNCKVVQYLDRTTLSDPSDAIICRECDNNFVSMPNLQMCYAIDCSIVDPDTGVCKQCLRGFEKDINGDCILVRMNQYCPNGQYPNATFACVPPQAKNCLGANPRNTTECFKCSATYYLRQKTCHAYTNCLKKNYYFGCLQCEPGFQADFKSGECLGRVDHCVKFDKNNGDCLECQNGYQVVFKPQRVCKEIPVWCGRLDGNGVCMECRVLGKVLTKEKDGCISPTSNCTKYDNIDGYCIECENGFYPKTLPKGRTCNKNPPNCQHVDPQTQNCTKCIQQTIQSNNHCFPPIPLCVQYNGASCKTCFPGYYPIKRQQECGKLPSFCKKIINDTQCGECNQNFIPVQGSCVKIIQFCKQYDRDVCGICQDGYAVAGGGLICVRD